MTKVYIDSTVGGKKDSYHMNIRKIHANNEGGVYEISKPEDIYLAIISGKYLLNNGYCVTLSSGTFTQSQKPVGNYIMYLNIDSTPKLIANNKLEECAYNMAIKVIREHKLNLVI